jgi:hypothetical protein
MPCPILSHKLIGRANKGHPDAKALEDVRAFTRGPMK